jgi:hypothetical protein
LELEQVQGREPLADAREPEPERVLRLAGARVPERVPQPADALAPEPEPPQEPERVRAAGSTAAASYDIRR